MRNKPEALQKYRHFKGNVYEIVTLAMHTEDDEELVVYRSVEDKTKVFARPLKMFLSEVDHDKYPDISEKYRFSLIKEDYSEISDADYAEDAEENENDISDAINEEDEIFNLVEKIIDEKDFTVKIHTLELLRGRCTDLILNNIALSLDISLKEGDVEDKYEDLLRCLRTHEKYEIRRLR